MGAPKGNKYTQKYNEEQATELFLQMLEFSKTDKCLCVQDAFLYVDLPSSTFHHLINKFKVLERIKKDIDANIISKINKKGLEGDLNPTLSIWRMKQLGEKDRQETLQTNINYEGVISKEELQKERDKHNDELDNY